MSSFETQSKVGVDVDKIIAVMSYFTVIGWLLSLLLYGKYKSPLARFHLRQSLGLIVTAAILSFIPLIGWLLNIALIFFWLTAIYQAFIGHHYTLPILGDIYQEHLDFIR